MRQDWEKQPLAEVVWPTESDSDQKRDKNAFASPYFNYS